MKNNILPLVLGLIFILAGVIVFQIFYYDSIVARIISLFGMMVAGMGVLALILEIKFGNKLDKLGDGK